MDLTGIKKGHRAIKMKRGGDPQASLQAELETCNATLSACQKSGWQQALAAWLANLNRFQVLPKKQAMMLHHEVHVNLPPNSRTTASILSNFVKHIIYLESRKTIFFWSLWEKAVMSIFFSQRPSFPEMTTKKGQTQ